MTVDELPADLRARAEEIRSRRTVEHGPQFFNGRRPGRVPAGYITVREAAVVALIAQGLWNREIAEMLVITEETVKSHVRHILGRTGSRNRAHLAARYVRREFPIFDARRRR